MRRALAVAAAVLVFLAALAHAEEPSSQPVRFLSSSLCTTEAGSVRHFPPGVFLPAQAYDALDQEVTRLASEVKQLRDSSPTPTIKAALLLSAFLGGVVVGALLVR